MHCKDAVKTAPSRCVRTSFPVSFSKADSARAPGSLTAEAALVLPFFFMICVFVLQYAVVMRTAAQYSGALTSTAQEMAVAAYKEQYSDANHILRAALSDTWATSQVINKVPDKDAVRLASFLNSSYLKEDNLIKLVLSYQPRPKFNLFTMPFTFFVQKAVVRGWTGKENCTGNHSENENQDPAHQTVYVTDHGSVYHTNPNCSHLKITIIPVTESQLKKARNLDGCKYKKCPYCGNKGGGSLYVDPYGNCWHTSLDCPSLKRSTHEVSLDECGHMHECKDCKKARGG